MKNFLVVVARVRNDRGSLHYDAVRRDIGFDAEVDDALVFEVPGGTEHMVHDRCSICESASVPVCGSAQLCPSCSGAARAHARVDQAALDAAREARENGTGLSDAGRRVHQ